MHIQFQLAQQCIQIPTRINSSSVHTYIFVCFTLRVILQGFVDPIMQQPGRTAAGVSPLPSLRAVHLPTNMRNFGDVSASQRSCGEVIFSQVSVCSQGWVGNSGPMSFPSGYPWYQASSWTLIQWDTVGKQLVRILLECFLVHNFVRRFGCFV